MSPRPDAMELWEEAGGGTPGFDLDRWHALIRERILGEGSEFPGPGEVNWGLLNEIAGRPHPLVNNEWQPSDVEDPGHATEMFHEMRNVHHLLDLAGVPHGYGIDTRDIDCRVLLAVRGLMTLRERLARIAGWHARETGPAGTVGDQCFAGSERYWTCAGLKTFAETVGTCQRVLTAPPAHGGGPGVWREAQIRSFGQQQLWEVELRRNGRLKAIYTTAGHRWVVRNKRPLNERIVLTKDLLPGKTLQSLLPRRDSHTRPSPFGIAHGIVYGDGNRTRKGSTVRLWGEKDAQLLRFFADCRQSPIKTQNGVTGVQVRDLPGFFKDRPSLDESASYLYGWLAGYFAADGTVGAGGYADLCSARVEDLEFAQLIAARLGIGTYDIRTQMRVGIDGTLSPTHRMQFMTVTLEPQFFLIRDHRLRHETAFGGGDHRYWTVVSVTPTDRVEEVFCAVVPESESFVLDGWIHTMNCTECGHRWPCDTRRMADGVYADED